MVFYPCAVTAKEKQRRFKPWRNRIFRKAGIRSRIACHALRNVFHSDGERESVTWGVRSSSQVHKPDSNWVSRSFHARTRLAMVCSSKQPPGSDSDASATASTVLPCWTASTKSSCKSRAIC